MLATTTKTLTMLPGPEPKGPESLAIATIHRHRDGIVTFHRKRTDGVFENLSGVRIGHLADVFPEFRQQLERDSYFSINAFWHPNVKRNYFNAGEVRRSDRLRYLCAAYTDVDCHRLGIEFGMALGTAITYQDKHQIPPVSIFQRSGRGLWMFWVLRHSDYPERPPGAYPRELRQYLAINRALNERLAGLGADAGAMDGARITRVEGSVHSGALRATFPRVKYWVQAGEDGQPQTYTLDELSEFLGIQQKMDTRTQAAFQDVQADPGARKRGHTALNLSRLRDFELLRQKRGGFREGQRNYACLIYTLLLARGHSSREDTRRDVAQLAAECRPPLPQTEYNGALKTVWGRRLVKLLDQTIGDWLDITPEEADDLERFPPASRFGETMPVIEFTKTERHRAIQQIVATERTVPPARAVALWLTRSGHPTSHVTILRDLAELGLASDRTREAVTARRGKQLVLIPGA